MTNGHYLLMINFSLTKHDLKSQFLIVTFEVVDRKLLFVMRKTILFKKYTYIFLFQVRTLFVSGLPMDTKPRELYLLFRAYEVMRGMSLQCWPYITARLEN